MESLSLMTVLPVSSKEVYANWLNSQGHSAMTGGEATIEPKKGSSFVAWNGYISGKILELEESTSILMLWRTSEFPTQHESSVLEIKLQGNEHSCVLFLRQWNIPDGDGEKYKTGWDEHYFQPMIDYFGEN